ncbi:hypothetical protein ABZ281_13855, partial [Streptomyces sp. NPDC006265]
MSNARYETYETYGPAYADPVCGGFGAPPAGLHSAETLAHSTPGTPGTPGAHADTYRPAYEAPTLAAHGAPALAAYEAPT